MAAAAAAAWYIRVASKNGLPNWSAADVNEYVWRFGEFKHMILTVKRCAFSLNSRPKLIRKMRNQIGRIRLAYYRCPVLIGDFF